MQYIAIMKVPLVTIVCRNYDTKWNAVYDCREGRDYQSAEEREKGGGGQEAMLG